LVPLIGFVALGAEAGSWYVVKTHAQNTADSAALSGAYAIENGDTQANFGTLNGFPSNVTVTQGNYSSGSGFSAGGAPTNAVQAVVTECVPQSLSLVVYTGSCNGTSKNVLIKAQAVANVAVATTLPCVLATGGPVTFQDAAVQVNAPNCGIASNGTPIGIDFKVAPKQLNVGSISTAGGCTGSLCGSVMTYTAPVVNPFDPLRTGMNGLTIANSCGSTLTPYTSSNPCYNNGNINQATTLTTSGVYFFNGINLTGQGSLSTASGVSATIILLPNTQLKMVGGSSINITAPTTAPSASNLPAQLANYTNLLANMAIFDTETSPKINGGALMSGSGVFYLPNANPLNFQGNPTASVATCTEVIAQSIQFSGTPNFDNSGCPDSIKLKRYLVVLVQ
jgi:hypothetical protein